MKSSILFCIALYFSLKIEGQVNLVPNPSFELYSTCPDNASGVGDDQLARSLGWSTYSETPDYFHSCAAIWNIGVPNNQAGYQVPHSGNAYGGLITFYQVGQYREIIGRALSTPLLIGQKYYISFFTSFAGNLGANRATNKIGLKFSNTSYSESNPIPINNQAQVYTDSIISDSLNWVRISGSFIADSAYQYIGIGNFFNDSNTDTLSMGASAFTGYYFIDDVCVSTDSLYNETWTGINDLDENVNGFSVFPNPFASAFSVTPRGIFRNKPTSIELLNSLGVKLMDIPSNNSTKVEVILNVPPGTYILRIECSGQIYYKLIIKQQ